MAGGSAPAPAGTISFDSSSVSKTYGDDAFINVLTNTGDGSVMFSSSDTSVATVDSGTGQVTIVKAGNAIITATVTDGETSHYEVNTASYTLSVAKASRMVTFVDPIMIVGIGDSVTNAATISAGASDGTLTYSSSNTSYATVNNSGVVTGVAQGSTTITATISGGTNYLDATGSYSITAASLQPVAEDFAYTGSVQSKILAAGIYKLECWGAQGGSVTTGGSGGKGGYSVGVLTLSDETTVYIYVGGQGVGRTSVGSCEGGFNGGGRSYSTTSSYYNGSGGGASDIRIGQDSLYARVIVAGGGGGFGRYNSSNILDGGYGGGATGGNGGQYDTAAKCGEGGTQAQAGDSYYGMNKNVETYGTIAAFGVGGGAISGNTSYRTVGGGGGWYGGGYSQRAGAGGGSGYVYNSNSKNDYPSGCLLNDSHLLSDASTTAGNASMPSTSGGTETGHEGNGFVRITKIA